MIAAALRWRRGSAIAAIGRTDGRQADALKLLPVVKLARTYAVWTALTLLGFSVLIGYVSEPKIRPTLVSESLFDKLAYYKIHKSEFNLLLIGDSLTYTGLHPEFIDASLGTHSVNLARFANWFATQYPFIQDIIPVIPRGTRVVWSVHLYDFNDDGLTVPRVYPVGLPDAVRYWSWGARYPGLLDNVLYYNSLTRFFMQTGELRERVILRGEKPLPFPGIGVRALANPLPGEQAESGQSQHAGFINNAAATEAGFPAVPEFVSLQNQALPESEALKTRLTQYYSRLPSVGAISPVSDRGQINSVVLYLKGGGYYRIELTPGYFREKQREMAKSLWHLNEKAAEKYIPPPLGPAALKMFEAQLAEFRRAGIPVTVNAMEEAPFTFPNEIVREKFRHLMDETLQPIIRRYGDDYVHADYSSIIDSDYFDYNHFNSSGIVKYTPLLVNALRKTNAFSRMAQH